MFKNNFALFLFLVFANFIVAPTVISFVDSEVDVSMAFNLNEEENKEIEFEKDEVQELLNSEIIDFSFLDFSNKADRYNGTNYSQLFTQLHLPPPESV